MLPGSCGNGSIEYLITSSPSSSSQSSYLYEYLVRFVFLVQKPGGVKCPFQEGPGDVEVKIPSFIGARAGKLIEFMEVNRIEQIPIRGNMVIFSKTKLMTLSVRQNLNC